MDKISYRVQCVTTAGPDKRILPMEEFFKTILGDYPMGHSLHNAKIYSPEPECFSKYMCESFKDIFEHDPELAEKWCDSIPRVNLIEVSISDMGIAQMKIISVFYPGIYLEYLKSIQ